MRKIKKQTDKTDEVIELLTTTLDEYFTPFMLMAKSEKPEVKTFYDSILSRAMKSFILLSNNSKSSCILSIGCENTLTFIFNPLFFVLITIFVLFYQGLFAVYPLL